MLHPILFARYRYITIHPVNLINRNRYTLQPSIKFNSRTPSAVRRVYSATVRIHVANERPCCEPRSDGAVCAARRQHVLPRPFTCDRHSSSAVVNNNHDLTTRRVSVSEKKTASHHRRLLPQLSLSAHYGGKPWRAVRHELHMEQPSRMHVIP